VVASIGVHGRILVAARAEGLGVDVPAPIAPEVPAATVAAEMDGAAVAEYDGIFFPANLAEFFAVRDNHGERFPSSVKFSSLIYMMRAEKASPLPGSDRKEHAKRGALKAAS
jgi:hypothetical protein